MHIRIAASVLLALAGAARAQSFVNGDFETGDLSGWTVVNTSNGVGAPGAAFQIDMDDAGPLPTSWAAGFMVGNATPTGNHHGVEMTQTLSLTQGTVYTVDFDWSARRLANVGNSGGIFAVIVGGVEVGSVTAGPLSGTSPAIGHFSSAFTAFATGPAEVGLRITREFLAPGDLTNYVDNVTIAGGTTGGCYPNCDSSTTAPVLNVADFTCFLQRFAAGESYANCDESTTAPTLNVADFTCFLQSFAAGCP